MRNPNGYGCIKHLSGRRRRPFVFVVTDEGRQKPVEYFTNLVDAQIFQADYHRAHHHRSLPGHKITFAELYHRWLPRHTEDTQPSQSTLGNCPLGHIIHSQSYFPDFFFKHKLYRCGYRAH